jgi:hypothetical protein
MIRPPQLIAHSSQGKRAPTPCYDRAGLGRVPVRRISLIFDRDSRERGSWQAGTVYLLIGALCHAVASSAAEVGSSSSVRWQVGN